MPIIHDAFSHLKFYQRPQLSQRYSLYAPENKTTIPCHRWTVQLPISTTSNFKCHRSTDGARQLYGKDQTLVRPRFSFASRAILIPFADSSATCVTAAPDAHDSSCSIQFARKKNLVDHLVQSRIITMIPFHSILYVTSSLRCVVTPLGALKTLLGNDVSLFASDEREIKR